MSEELRIEEPFRSESEEYRGYERSERRRMLFRVLAENVVRELRSAGHHGSDLLGFVSQLMEAVTDRGFGDDSVTPPPPVVTRDRPTLIAESDQWQRPSVITSRVILRPLAESDLPAMEQWQTDPTIQASLAPAVLDHVRRHVSDEQRSQRVDLVTCDPESATPFGIVALYNIDRETRQAEIAKMIGDPRFRGRGLAAAATSLLLEYGFRTLGLNRIYLRTLGGNLRNIRLNERMGFRFEGVLREAHMRKGKREDIVLMALLSREFEQLHPRGKPRVNEP